MQHVNPNTQPRRTIIWDETTARYIFLDQNEKLVAQTIRARRAAFALETVTPAAYTCSLGDLYDPRDFSFEDDLRGKYVRTEALRQRTSAVRKAGARQATRR